MGAEFVIDQHEKCGGKLPEFKAALAAMGADFPNSLVESVDRLILTMHPKYKVQKKSEQNEKSDLEELDAIGRKARVFRGLAVPDREQAWDDYEDDMVGQKTIDESRPPDPGTPADDDTFALLEGHCGGGRGRPDRFEIPASAKPYWGQHHIPLIINASRRRLSMTGQTYARYSTVKRGFA